MLKVLKEIKKLFGARELCAAVVLISMLTASADDLCARRYAGLDRDATTSKYSLLGIKAVQSNLKLSSKQLQLFEDIMRSSPTNIPAIVDLRNSKANLIAHASSEGERAGIRRSMNSKVDLLIHRHFEAALQNVLSPAQVARLNELFMQMEGPNVILCDTNLATRLNLTKDQMEQMNEVAARFSQILTSLRGRFLGLEIQTARKRSAEDVDSEIRCLTRVITEIEKDRDEELLGVLDEGQRRVWNDLCGSPLPIHWPTDSFAYDPFK